MAHDFTWVDGERLIRFGFGALDEAPALAQQRGFAGYVLLSTERALAQAPAGLGEAAGAVLNVPPGPVPDAAAAVRVDVGGRPLVAFGGGRVIDAAKAIAGADGLDCAAVPTTLSGAEMTRFHRMPAGVEGYALKRPTLVVADPDAIGSAPAEELAASAMNALAHALEALYGPLANPVATMAALRAAELIRSGLAPAEPRSEALALGSLLGAYAMDSAGFAIHHALCQTIVRTLGTPHAQTNAVVLPHCVRAMTARAPEPLAGFAAALGSDDAAGAVEGLAARAGVTRLSELGVERGDLDRIVTEARGHPAYANTPQAPDASELMRLLEAAL